MTYTSVIYVTYLTVAFSPKIVNGFFNPLYFFFLLVFAFDTVDVEEGQKNFVGGGKGVSLLTRHVSHVTTSATYKNGKRTLSSLSLPFPLPCHKAK